MDLTLPTRRVPSQPSISSISSVLSTSSVSTSRSNRKARRALAAVALAGAGVVGALAGAPAVSAAPEAPAAVASPDGCTGVPDSGPSFNFLDACNGHDGCYERKPYGDSWTGRLRCDNDFLDAMVGWCKDNHSWWSPLRGTCLGVAATYYDGVRKFGWAFF